MVWSDILKEDNSSVIQEYKVKLQEMLQKSIQDGEENVLDYGVIIFHLSSKK